MKVLYVCAFALLSLSSLTNCKKADHLDRYGLFRVLNDSTVTMNGTINGRTDNHFESLMKDYPDIKWIEMGDCPGSMNDEVNLEVAKQIHDLGMNTRLYSHSEIASGAVDLFLAGHKREIESGAMIGVHSWATLGKNANELPEDDPQHDLYINYYVYVGMSAEAAHEFYFFTINSAEASDIHWMTEEEIEYYQMAN